jgi:hypothetical protein
MVHPLWAKAMVIEDARQRRVAIVTLDLIGDNFGRDLADRIRKQCSKASTIASHEILFNFSHTHCGPVSKLNDGATVTYNLDEGQRSRVTRYTETLEGKLVRMIVGATRSMRPAELRFGESQANFAANRRSRHNPNGPTDDTVPVLVASDTEQRTIAVLFGYACHTASLTGEFNQYCGDYAGFTQAAIERAHPGATALFMMGCGADANPSPRGQLALAQQHGAALAEAVNKVVTGDATPLAGPLSVQLERVDLHFVNPPTREHLEQRRKDGDAYDQRLTRVLLQRLAKHGSLQNSYPFPIHVVRFGQGLSMIALGGETVVDYALRLRSELSPNRLWVAGYSNEVFAYVPSERVLAEGGYEGGGAMKYFGIHGPFRPGLEEKIVKQVKRMMEASPE